MYKNIKYMIKYFFSSSVCLEEIKMLQIYVKIARHAASGRIPVFHCSNANSEDISTTKILISRYHKGVFDEYEDIFIIIF